MIPCKPVIQKLTRLLLFFGVFIAINKVSAQDAKAIFQSKCASCHKLGADMTGPNLQGVIGRWGGNMEQIRVWVHNYAKAVEAGYPEAIAVEKFSQSSMTQFGDAITDAEIDAVIKYADSWTPPVVDKGKGGDNGGKEDNSGAVIFGVISLILAIIALILMQVNSNLKKLSDDAEGIHRPEPVPFYRNKVYIAMVAIVFFVVAGFFLSKAAIGLGRQKGYEPKQPIFYSHKVHAGINQINCLYCHGNAWESRHAAIPSVNVCMNCHRTIQSYGENSAKIYDEVGNEVNGSGEIQKLYKYAGFDPKNADKWDPTKAKPIEWEKIHNLPDHVYFNHSQHIRAGKVQCQTCHGEITAMDEVKQVAELSMSWCINCHRNTKVDFNTDSTGNKFYSIYEKFHNDIKNHKMDSVTVKDIGGTECQKCHY
jgi:mono/diheme cytochrome c family protein